MTSIEYTQPTNVFADCVPVPSAQEEKVAETMGKFNDLGTQLAEIMRERLMPVEQIRVGKDDVEDTETAIGHWGERIPMWIVLRKKDLSGRAMFSGSIGVGPSRHSLGSAEITYNSEEAFDKARRELRAIDQISAAEGAVAVDYLGLFRPLYRGYRQRRWEHSPPRFSLGEFTLAEDPLMVDNLFDVSSAWTVKDMTAAMEKCMKVAIREYTKQMNQERAELAPGETLTRHPDYYLPKNGLLYVTEKRQSLGQKKRGGFLRLFNR